MADNTSRTECGCTCHTELGLLRAILASLQHENALLRSQIHQSSASPAFDSSSIRMDGKPCSAIDMSATYDFDGVSIGILELDLVTEDVVMMTPTRLVVGPWVPFGVDPKTVIGKPMKSFGADPAKVKRWYDRCLRALERPLSFEDLSVAEEPPIWRRTWIEHDGYSAETGRPRIQYVSADIQDQKHQQIEALKVAERWRKLVETAPCGIFVTDMEGVLLFQNTYLQSILTHLQEIELPERYAERVEQWKSEVRESQYVEGVNEQVYHYKFDNGEEHYLLKNSSVLKDEHGNPNEILVVSTDVTAQKKVEMELAQKYKELDAALRAANIASDMKQAFVQTLSHEIRTPLNGILGAAALLEDAALTSEERDLVKIMKDCGEGLLLIIGDILDFSKLQAGKMDTNMIPFEPGRCILESMDTLRFKAKENELDWGYDMDEDIPSFVLGDPARVRQIMWNLLSNAVKFTPKKGSIRAALSIDEETDDHIRLHFSVRDTGIGISEEGIARLFQPFSQVSGSRDFGGTGLGLCICSDIVQLLGGKIWVDSTVGKGSTFHFTMQAQRAPPEFTTPRSPQLKHTSSPSLAPPPPPPLRSHSPLSTSSSARSSPVPTSTSSGVDTPLQGSPATKRKADDALLANPKVGVASKKPSPCAFRPSNGNRTGGTSLMVGYPMKVLVVEDNAVNMKLALQMLKKLGINDVSTAGDGEAAIDSVIGALSTESAFDIILMDIQMPRLDGINATLRIRKHPEIPHSQQPAIVALTANAMSEERDKCLAAGMGAFLTKPYKKDDLVAVLIDAWEKKMKGCL